MKITFSFLLLFIGFSSYSQFCTTVNMESNLYSPSKVITLDFNGDGLKDIAFLDSVGYQLYWKRNQGGDNYSAAIPLVDGAKIEYLTSGDMNNDNYDELLLTTSTTVYYIVYSGPTTIQVQSLFDTPPFYYFSGLEMGDFNNDGSYGFVMSYYRASTFNLIIDVVNNANGNLTLQNIENITSGNISDIVVGDITGNNRPDIATVGYNLLWYRNISSTGNFSDNIIIASATSQHGRIELMDYDNDNQVELVNLNSSGVLKTYDIDITGGGWIYSPSTILSNLPTSNPVFEKVTRNGIDQLLIKKGSSLVALENTGNSFVEKQLCTNMSGLNGVTLLNNTDGSTDVCFSDVTGGKINRLKISSLSLEDNFSEKFSLFPNPTTGIFEISSEVPIQNIKISNSLGQNCEIEKLGNNKFSIDNLDEGVYQLILQDINGNITVQSVMKTF